MESLDKLFNNVDNPERAGYLIGGFITGTLTIEESEELDQWILEDDKNMQLFEDMTSTEKVDEFLKWLSTRSTESKLEETKKKLKFKSKASVSWLYYAAAASIVIAVVFWFARPNNNKENNKENVQSDIQPGSLLAHLLLPNGKRVQIHSTSDTSFDGVQVRDGLVELLRSSDSSRLEISIPRKGYFTLKLPDGSFVWLNSESTISFPTRFGKTRQVSITGEAYFEVVSDRSKPFIVKFGNRQIDVLGTRFNVNSFENRISLAEGRISISGNVLKPGQQCDSTGRITSVEIASVISWTKNQFKFRDLTLDEIKPQLERWYDAGIIMEDTIPYHFNGTIDRSVSLSTVMKLLQQTGHFRYRISDNTVYISK
jgi:transmembrane sensor